MSIIPSPDGTPIALYRAGAGPPLVLVNGAGAARPSAWPAFPFLAERFTVITFDRRGRGASGDTLPYALEREYEDVAAVAAAAGEPVALLGHSFGGLCALGAALLTPSVRRLVLYEPALPLPGAPLYPAGLAARLQALLDAGDAEQALLEFYREAASMSPAEVEALRASPAWPQRLAAAHTVPRELRAEQDFVFEPQRFNALQVPTLLLVGGDSPPSLSESARRIAAALPNARVAHLPGQAHVAMYTAPELFAQEVIGFLA